MYDPQRVIDAAFAEIGYKEKATNAQLDSPTENAGNKNYTKFAAFMDSIKGFFNGRKQGVAWCAVFVCYCFVKAFGVDVARKLLNLPANSSAAGVRWMRIYMRRKRPLVKDPQPGDIIFFKIVGSTDPDAMQHVGLVYGKDAKYVYTIEGNTSNSVGKRKYLLTDIKIADYGRPAWDADYGTPIPVAYTQSIPVVSMPTLRKGSTGEIVRTLQEALNKSGGSLVVDGLFGAKTLAEVKVFQKLRGITVDGIVGPVTWALLKAVG